MTMTSAYTEQMSEVTCPDGVYRLEFFGPRMDEQGYHVKEAKARL